MPSHLHPSRTLAHRSVAARASTGATRALCCALLASVLLGVSAESARSDSTPSADTPAAPLLTPALTLAKSGPASATAGELITYSLAVTNSGGTAFDDAMIVVADPQCQASPALLTRNGDPSPATLSPGETWTYSCQVATAAGQQALQGTASVTGTDSSGNPVSATGAASTTLSQPAAQVLPQLAVGGVTAAARLRGTSGCAAGAYARASVFGHGIRSVTFHLNGSIVRAKAKRTGLYELRLALRTLEFGSHAITARVVFVTEARLRAKTLRLRFARCAARVVRPAFTG